MSQTFIAQTAALLGEIGIKPSKPRFYLEINLDAEGKPSSVYSSDTDTVFRVKILPLEWELLVNAPGKASWGRFYADAPPFVSSDKLGLFARKPQVTAIPKLLRAAEKKLGVVFPRVAYVRTNVAGGKKAVAAWVQHL